jgi:hypothetical protein
VPTATHGLTVLKGDRITRVKAESEQRGEVMCGSASPLAFASGQEQGEQ